MITLDSYALSRRYEDKKEELLKEFFADKQDLSGDELLERGEWIITSEVFVHYTFQWDGKDVFHIWISPLFEVKHKWQKDIDDE